MSDHSGQSIQQLYQRVRSQVRELGYRDSLELIWAYAQYLQIRNFKFPSYIEVNQKFLKAELPQRFIAELNSEELTREVIRYADEEPRRGKTLRRWATLAVLVQYYGPSRKKSMPYSQARRKYFLK